MYKIQTRNPKPKRPRLGLPQKERRLQQSKIQNAKSKPPRLDVGFWSLDFSDRVPLSDWVQVLNHKAIWHGVLDSPQVHPFWGNLCRFRKSHFWRFSGNWLRPGKRMAIFEFETASTPSMQREGARSKDIDAHPCLSVFHLLQMR